MQPLSIGETQLADLRRIPLTNAAVPGRAPQAGAGSGLGVAGQPARITIGVAGMNPLIRGTNSMRWSVSPDALEVRWYVEREFPLQGA